MKQHEQQCQKNHQVHAQNGSFVTHIQFSNTQSRIITVDFQENQERRGFVQTTLWMSKPACGKAS